MNDANECLSVLPQVKRQRVADVDEQTCTTTTVVEKEQLEEENGKEDDEEDDEEEDSEHDDWLYRPRWACPICYDVLGTVPGMVPMISVSCRPVAHLVCYRCVLGLAEKRTSSGVTYKVCPLCNQSCDFLPAPVLVNCKKDSAAKVILEKFKYQHNAPQIGRKPARPAPAAALEQPQQVVQPLDADDIVRRRAQKVLKRAQRVIAADTASGFDRPQTRYWWPEVPAWDETYVRLTTNCAGFPKITYRALHNELCCMAAEVDSLLQGYFAGSEYVVQMSRSQKLNENSSSGRFVYLAFTIRKVGQQAANASRPAGLQTSIDVDVDNSNVSNAPVLQSAPPPPVQPSANGALARPVRSGAQLFLDSQAQERLNLARAERLVQIIGAGFEMPRQSVAPQEQRVSVAARNGGNDDMSVLRKKFVVSWTQSAYNVVPTVMGVIPLATPSTSFFNRIVEFRSRLPAMYHNRDRWADWVECTDEDLHRWYAVALHMAAEACEADFFEFVKCQQEYTGCAFYVHFWIDKLYEKIGTKNRAFFDRVRQRYCSQPCAGCHELCIRFGVDPL